MGTQKTALGRNLDMAALIAKNERVRAVSNQSVNARGDTIDIHGNILVPVTQKTGENYVNSVKNKSAQAKPSKSTSTTPALVSEPAVVTDQEFTSEEKELNENLQEDLEIENLKNKTTK